MPVLDASAAVALVLRKPGAPAIEQHMVDAGFDVHAPHVLDFEVISALRGMVMRGEQSEARAAEAIEDLLDLPVQRHSHTVLLRPVWELRHNFSAYDAAYVVLAEVLVAPLLTADGRLARAVATHSSASVLLAE